MAWPCNFDMEYLERLLEGEKLLLFIKITIRIVVIVRYTLPYDWCHVLKKNIFNTFFKFQLIYMHWNYQFKEKKMFSTKISKKKKKSYVILKNV